MREAHVQVAGQTRIRMAVDSTLLQFGQQPRAQTIAKMAEAHGFGRHFPSAQPAGGAEADDVGYRQSSAAHSPFVAAAVKQRLQSHVGMAPANIERSNALGSIHFMG